MKRCNAVNSSGIDILILVLVSGTGGLWAAAQSQPQQSAADTSVEVGAFRAADSERDPQAQIKLLDDFAAKYPDSALLPQEYRDYYLAYLSVPNYSQTIKYADLLLALGDKADFNLRMSALLDREIAYSLDCGDSTLQTPEAHAKAKDLAAQGLQMLGQWQKPDNLTDAQFSSQKASAKVILDQIARATDSGLNGTRAGCIAPPPPPNDPGNFERMINDIKADQRQTPRVR